MYKINEEKSTHDNIGELLKSKKREKNKYDEKLKNILSDNELVLFE